MGNTLSRRNRSTDDRFTHKQATDFASKQSEHPVEQTFILASIEIPSGIASSTPFHQILCRVPVHLSLFLFDKSLEVLQELGFGGLAVDDAGDALLRRITSVQELLQDVRAISTAEDARPSGTSDAITSKSATATTTAFILD